MNVKERISSSKVKTTPLLKAATEIARNVSNLQLKIAELTEYCRVSENKTKELDHKIEVLTLAKHESEKLRTDYTTRNKINLYNTESLLQAKNQLNKYKCELKSEYVTVQREMKAKKLKYDKIISSYESEWRKTLDQYNCDPLVIELEKIRRENENLEKEIASLEKLQKDWAENFLDLEKKLEKKFREEILNFSKEMINYRIFLENDRIKKASQVKEKQVIPKENEESFVKKIAIFCTKNLINLAKDKEPAESHDEIFELDEIMIPIENLEKIEEDLSLFMLDGMNCEQNNESEKIFPEASKQEPRNLKPIRQFKKSVNSVESKKSKKKFSKHTVSPENESEYFNSFKQTQTQTKRSQVESASNANGNFEQEENNHQAKKINLENNMKPSSQNTRQEVEYHGVGEIETSKKNLEENSSNGSFESQYSQYNWENKFVDNKPTANSEYEGSVGSPTSIQSPKPKQEKNGFEAFKGFFTMDNEQTSPTPSIFKLF